MSAPGSGSYEGTGEDGGRARPPAPGQGPLVQVPSGPLVQRLDLRDRIAALAEWFGLDPVTFEGPCPLPGHTGRARLASGLREDRHGDVRLLCCRSRWRSLGEVRAAIAYRYDDGGRPYEEGGRSNTELAVWTRRLAYEIGAFQPKPVPVPPLPPGASPATKEVWEEVPPPDRAPVGRRPASPRRLLGRVRRRLVRCRPRDRERRDPRLHRGRHHP
jgi:hypothetical protein